MELTWFSSDNSSPIYVQLAHPSWPRFKAPVPKSLDCSSLLCCIRSHAYSSRDKNPYYQGYTGLGLRWVFWGTGLPEKWVIINTSPNGPVNYPTVPLGFFTLALSGCPAQAVYLNADPLPTCPTPILENTPPIDPSNFTWNPPNLQEEGKLSLERTTNLKTACSTYLNAPDYLTMISLVLIRTIWIIQLPALNLPDCNSYDGNFLRNIGRTFGMASGKTF